MPKKTFWLACLVTGAGLLLLLILVLSLGGDNAELLKREGGIIETASAAGYFICTAYILAMGGRAFRTVYVYFPLLVVLFGFRELDFDKAFTTMGIFKSRFYISPEVPLWEKCIGVLFIILLLWILYSLIRNHGAAFLRSVRRFDPVGTGVLLVILLAGVAKSIDGIPRKLEALGISSGETFAYRFGVVEEVLELGIPIFMILSFYAYLKAGKTAVDGNQEAN